MWKTPWRGAQHTVFLVELLTNVHEHSALRDASLHGLSLQYWLAFVLSLVVVLPSPAVIMPYWDSVIDRFADITSERDGHFGELGQEATPAHDGANVNGETTEASAAMSRYDHRGTSS